MQYVRGTSMIVVGLTIGCHGSARPVSSAPQQSVVTGSDTARAVAWSQAPVSSSRVRPGEVEGLVVDTDTGEPLSYVQATFLQTTRMTITDSAGRFWLPVPNAGGVLRVARIGYGMYRTELPASDSGRMLVVALRRQPIRTCRVSVGTAVIVQRAGVRRMIGLVQHYPGVIVIARDAMTAAAPTSPVFVSVRDGAYFDSTTARADSIGKVVATLALDRNGRYDIRVRSEGYRDWSATLATTPIAGCPGEFAPVVANVWLVPR